MRLASIAAHGATGLAVLVLHPLGPQAFGADRAEPELEDEVWRGVLSSFQTPLGQLLDGTAQEGLSARYALSVPMKYARDLTSGSGVQGEPTGSPTLQFGLKYVPLTSWFVSVTLLKYLRGDEQKSWDPDFTYAFGYDDWHPYTFSAQYANYGGNRLHPDRQKGERRTNFNAGSWNLSFKFPVTGALRELLQFSADDSIGCSVGTTLVPRFSDAATNSVKSNKWTLGFGCKYAFSNNWYFNFNTIRYLSSEQQQPWDPDFTYGFGYFDWRPGSWSVQYNNFAGNRFPWSGSSTKAGRFRDGSLTLSYSHNWL
jgi:hypothetical protein